jgi:hypothetical protein
MVVAIVGVATVYVLWEVRLPLILRTSTPTFNELGMHLHDPAYLRDALFPRLSGWSQDYFAGAPVGTFYFPVPSLLTVILDVLLPYNVAFKLVTAAGLIALPACAYAFGRLHGQDRLTSACVSLGSLPFLLLPTTKIGGSISATVASEYPYSLGVAAALLTVGVAGAGLRTGRHRALTAGLLAFTFLLHGIPGAMAVVGILLLVAVDPARARVRWAAPVLGAGGAAAGFLLVPFILRQHYAGGGIYPKAGLDDYLLLATFAPVLVLAVPGFVLALQRAGSLRDRFGAFLVAWGAAAALAVLVLPKGRLWNARFVPFVYLALCLLTGWAASHLGAFVDEVRRAAARGRAQSAPWAARAAAPLVLLLAVVLLWDSPVAAGLTTDARYDVSHMATLAYEGYQRSPDRAEYTDFVATARRVAREHGCGRAHWEWVEEDPNHAAWEDPRTGLAALLPYWTDGCIDSMQGLLLQSAPTAPFVSMANARLSSRGQPFDTALSMPKHDMAAGVEDLRALGVRYFFALSPQAKAEADATPGLRQVDETESFGPWAWKVYEVSDVSVVEPLAALPVVVKGASTSIGRWQDLAVRWFRSGDRAVPLAAGGPSSWPRRRGQVESVSAGSVAVSRVRVRNESVSFHVSDVGVPVLVKVSYFPNWRAHGAQGPWRATPNFMVVVPTSHDVTLRYGQTGVEWLGWLVTLLGVAGIVALAVLKPVEMPVAEAPEPEPVRRRPAPSKPKKAPTKRKKR